MSQPYELKYTDGGFWMPLQEFYRFAAELESAFGVSANVTNAQAGSLTFTLKPADSEQ